MTSGAAMLLEHLLPLLGQSSLPPAPTRPVVVIPPVKHIHPPDHRRMSGSAVFCAKQMVAAGFCGREPKSVIVAGHHIVLYAKGRNIKAVNHVFRCHRQLYWLAHWHVKFVDLTTAIRILNLP